MGGVAIARQMYRSRMMEKLDVSGGGDDTNMSAITGPTHLTSAGGGGGGQSSCYIPFSERQSKTAVAAHEALRKKKLQQKKNAPMSKADKMIQDVIKENHRFYQKNKGFSTFSA